MYRSISPSQASRNICRGGDASSGFNNKNHYADPLYHSPRLSENALPPAKQICLTCDQSVLPTQHGLQNRPWSGLCGLRQTIRRQADQQPAPHRYCPRDQLPEQGTGARRAQNHLKQRHGHSQQRAGPRTRRYRVPLQLALLPVSTPNSRWL